MTVFAFVFMSISMACVTCLTAFCLYRILKGGGLESEDD